MNKQYFPDKDDHGSFLLNLEWNLWVFDDVEKGDRIYSFKNDVKLDEYLRALEEVGFRILMVVDVEFVDETNNKIIVCKKG